MTINKTQMIAGILMTIGIFGIGFAFGYNWCFQEYNTTTEYINHSTNLDKLNADKFTELISSLKNETNDSSITFDNIDR